MLSFKSFIKKAKDTLPVVFMSAGGPPNSKLINSEHKDKVPAVYMNAGGPPENKTIKEETEYSHSIHKVLQDPSRDNTGIGTLSRNDHVHLIKPPKALEIRTYPYLSNQQADDYKTLVHHTNNQHPDYQPIVSKYTTGSVVLNEHLYESYLDKVEPQKIAGGIKIQKLDDLIGGHELPHNMTVYTGPHFDPSKYAGKVVHAPAYTSTSLTPHVAKDFGVGRHILRIHLPKGHPHLFMDHESMYQGQSEVVLPRGTNFKIAKEPSHIVAGNFNNHFEDDEEELNDYSFWDAHIVPGEK